MVLHTATTPRRRPRCADLLALVALAGCASGPTPLDLPPTAPTVRYLPNAEEPGAPVAAHAAAREVLLLAVAEAPDGTAVDAAALAIVRERGAPFRGRSRLPVGTRWLDDGAVARFRAAHPPGGEHATAVQRLGALAPAVRTDALRTDVLVPDSPLPEVHLFGEGGDGAAADGDVVEFLLPPRDEEPREVVRLAARLPHAEAGGLFVPDPRARRGGLLLLLLPTGAPSTDAIVAAEAEAAASAPVDGSPVEHARPAAWRVAMRSVGEHNRRPALLALYSPRDLDRVVDLLLTADEAALIAISQRLDRVPADAEHLSWRFERAAWSALLPRIQRLEMTPGMRAAAVRQLGALGEDATPLELLLQTATGLDAFEKGLVDENLVALDDRSAAVRVNAETWLRARGVVVEGYDAMAERGVRRKALRRHLTAEVDR